jgi:predicted transcriptional regulator
MTLPRSMGGSWVRASAAEPMGPPDALPIWTGTRRAGGEWDEFKATLKHITERLEHSEGNYKEYFRYYMAQALFQGDYAAWQKWNTATVRALSETQAADGSFNNGPFETGMSLLAQALNYRFLPIYER